MSLNIELIGNLVMLKFVEGHQMSLGRRAALGRVDAFESRRLRPAARAENNAWARRREASRVAA
jgi:hypothetical protein